MADLSINPHQGRLEGQLGALAFTFMTSWPHVSSAAVEKGELVVRIGREHLLGFLTTRRDDPRYRFEQLMDLCGVDWPQRVERFDVVYNLLSVTYNRRIRVIVTTSESAPVPSVHHLWPCATWWSVSVMTCLESCSPGSRICGVS